MKVQFTFESTIPQEALDQAVENNIDTEEMFRRAGEGVEMILTNLVGLPIDAPGVTVVAV